MTGSPPSLIAIDHDDYDARYVGRTAEDRQFFLTIPFVPAMCTAGGEFVALYLFDAQGKLTEARIDALGPRSSLDAEMRARLLNERLASLGEVTFGRITVAPFSITRFGVDFGLIACGPEDEDDVWAVEAHPGNYMAFYEPWDSGHYET